MKQLHYQQVQRKKITVREGCELVTLPKTTNQMVSQPNTDLVNSHWMNSGLKLMGHVQIVQAHPQY